MKKRLVKNQVIENKKKIANLARAVETCSTIATELLSIMTVLKEKGIINDEEIKEAYQKFKESKGIRLVTAETESNKNTELIKESNIQSEEAKPNEDIGGNGES